MIHVIDQIGHSLHGRLGVVDGARLASVDYGVAPLFAFLHTVPEEGFAYLVASKCDVDRPQLVVGMSYELKISRTGSVRFPTPH
jgi:hypothetical protein